MTGSQNPSPTMLRYPSSIGDNYEGYVDDEYGYHYHAWEVISASESKEQESIEFATPAELQEWVARHAESRDLFRWALAKRLHQEGRLDDYFLVLAPLLAPPHEEQALNYPEIFAQAAREEAKRGNQKRAHEIAGQLGEYWPLFAGAVDFLRGQLFLSAGDVESATSTYEEALGKLDLEDPELFFEIAEDYALEGFFDEGRHWIAKAEELIGPDGVHALAVDIALLLEKYPALTQSPATTEEEQEGEDQS